MMLIYTRNIKLYVIKLIEKLKKINRVEQQLVADACLKKILKSFGYINSKRTSKAKIGDLKVIDDSGKVITASDDTDKVEIFGNFFSSVFNTESQACNHTLHSKSTKFPN